MQPKLIFVFKRRNVSSLRALSDTTVEPKQENQAQDTVPINTYFTVTSPVHLSYYIPNSVTSKVIKEFPCDVMKGHWGVKPQLHSFWTSELDVGWWSASLYSRYHSTEGWMAPETVWVSWSSLPGTKPRFISCPVCSLVTMVRTVTFILLRRSLYMWRLIILLTLWGLGLTFSLVLLYSTHP